MLLQMRGLFVDFDTFSIIADHHPPTEEQDWDNRHSDNSKKYWGVSMSIISLEGSAEIGARTDMRESTESRSLLTISVFCLTGLAFSLAFMPIDISALAWL